MRLAVCLLFQGPNERVLRGLWHRLEAAGVASMTSHTHGRHVPHLSYAVLTNAEVGAVRTQLAGLP